MRVCLGMPGRPCPKAIAKGSRCSRCRGEFQRERKAKGRTGERGSTRASRERRAKVLRRDHGACVYSSAPATVADHYVPLAMDGPDTEANLVAACEPCNRAKADRPPGEFLATAWLAQRVSRVRDAGGTP